MIFRELTRKKKALGAEECLEVLRTEKRGVLSVIGDGGYPYGMPMNHYYCDEDGAVYFHSGKGKGHRNDALGACRKASFCVYDAGEREDGDWVLTVRSVIVFGRIETVEDPARVAEITAALSRKFTEDEAYIRAEIGQYLNATVLLRLVPEQITGKRVKES